MIYPADDTDFQIFSFYEKRQHLQVIMPKFLNTIFYLIFFTSLRIIFKLCLS